MDEGNIKSGRIRFGEFDGHFYSGCRGVILTVRPDNHDCIVINDSQKGLHLYLLFYSLGKTKKDCIRTDARVDMRPYIMLGVL